MKYLSSEIICRALCILLICFQAVVLNKFLVIYRGDLYWCWFIADFIVILSFPLIHHFAKTKLKERHESGNHHPNKDRKPDSIKFVYITWLTYAIFLSAKVCILFYNHADEVEERVLFGQNFLKTAVAITPLIFMFLVNGHHNGKSYIERKFYISLLIATVCFDLFDSIELLEYLFIPQESRPFTQVFADTLLGLSTLNIYLPAIALIELRVNQFSGNTPSMLFKALYMLTLVFLVNLPNLIMRSILWYHHSVEVSVLLMKNVICIMVGVFELHELFVHRPKRCKQCRMWYGTRVLNKSHREKCNSLMEVDNGSVKNSIRPEDTAL